ncbi:MAG: cytochrome c [Gemmatimonadota bacterium]|nr:cytochrome c [Gemmatimonadota bacterium]
MRQLSNPTARVASRAAVLVGLSLWISCGGSAPPDTMVTPGGAAPVDGTASFTVAQADRGRELFVAVCGECHSVGEFRGNTFQFTWRRRTAWDFYRTVSSTMPESAPGSLSDEEYVQIIAFVLGMNGYAPGSRDLAATEVELDQFVMNEGPGGS